jgi:nicotinamidase-related amidase
VDGDVVVHKRRSDSFFETDLEDQLKDKAVTHLVVGGCMTQFCVDTTARRAVSLGYNVTLVADGHMTADSETLTYADIVSHHNETLDDFDAGSTRINTRPAAAIRF